MQKDRVTVSLALAFALALLLGGCSTDAKIPGVYRIDVQQGNVVTQEDVNKLEPGMTKRQVRFLLGTPLIVDVFHQDRWDYYYSMRPGSLGGKKERQHVVLFFENDRLVRLEGDLRPGVPVAADAEGGGSEPVSVELKEKEEKGFFGRMLEKIGVGDD
ncbi:outer membrane protein assembly factor BamE [Thioalbus denitrificans]|uniref:Outer membrane protein assembly factor BamE n=1 Tax=Thioalbus denitrificans TaxID=547122 RepID=A0A369C950_9GAMM|nr:outer membrane protein assembly factor BamE [Thioalbus denitrificans]RCX28314.1 Beta-barrel assembly machine subunit BamE [Thioalbus denitrificans]